MCPPPLSPTDRHNATAFYWSGEALRSRSISSVVLSHVLEIPEPPARLQADWNRDITEQLQLEPGDVESLPLPRARTRWPGYARCVQTVDRWVASLGLSDILSNSEVALMACRGARYHHDGDQYGGAAFCNLFLSEDKGLDVHFPSTLCAVCARPSHTTVPGHGNRI